MGEIGRFGAKIGERINHNLLPLHNIVNWH